MDQLSFDDLILEVAPTLVVVEDVATDPLAQFDAWKPSDQLELVTVAPISAPLRYIDPDRITLVPISSSTMVAYQRSLSRAVWKPRFRNLAFTVVHDETIVALICLSSPVLNRIPVRDDHLGLPANDTERGVALREYADLSVCVGVQPLAWYWNVGKLAALLATTLSDYWTNAYHDELRGIITTSLWGKGSQYNRIYKHLGYTKGTGTSQIPDYVFDRMRQRLTADGNLPSFGPTNTNVRPKILAAYAKHYDPELRTLSHHGQRRGVYYHPAVPPTDRPEVVRGWWTRWGLPRYERTKDQTPPYVDGKGAPT